MQSNLSIISRSAADGNAAPRHFVTRPPSSTPKSTSFFNSVQPEADYTQQQHSGRNESPASGQIFNLPTPKRRPSTFRTIPIIRRPVSSPRSAPLPTNGRHFRCKVPPVGPDQVPPVGLLPPPKP